jgi:hypothetical protein
MLQRRFAGRAAAKEGLDSVQHGRFPCLWMGGAKRFFRAIMSAAPLAVNRQGTPGYGFCLNRRTTFAINPWHSLHESANPWIYR